MKNEKKMTNNHRHTDTHRTCYKCKEVKPVDQFYRRKTGTYFSACIPCQSVLRKERIAKLEKSVEKHILEGNNEE